MLRALGDFLEREAGHVVISFGIMLIGAALWKCGVPKAEDLIPAGLGFLGRSMGVAIKQAAEALRPEEKKP